MKISFNWLKQYIDISETPQQIADLLTRSGLEVEHVERIESIPGGLEGVVIGEVMTCVKHPDADKLSVTTVNIGNNTTVPIVCGAPNVASGQKVVVATVGSTLYPQEGDPLKIKKAKIRGEVSEGMICAEDELGLGTSHAGIIVLNTDLTNGTPAAKYFNLEADYIFEIGLTPNRADAASHIGVVRDLKALLNRSYQLPSVNLYPTNTANPIEVVVEDTAACIRYSGVTLSGLTVQESPDWLKQRLQAIGLAPINNIVDITNFILHELGQPLHAFDADKIAGKKVIVKTVAQGTPFVTLDNLERKLNASDLMICDADKPMCIAGVFGGANSGVTTQTQNIFLESACFAPDSVRRTSQLHGLKTDASFRFERGTDPNGTVYALKRAALLIQEVAGGSITSDIIDIYPNPVADFQIKVTYRNIDRLIGKALDRNLIKSTLSNLDIQVTEETAEGLSLRIPPYRVDVQREADVIEEILRIYGYDNIEIGTNLSADYLAEFPVVDREKLQQKATQLLASLGYHETITNSLTKPGYTQKFPATTWGEDVEILNKLSEDLGVMRQTLLFSGLEVLAYNLNRRQKDLKLFEFGKTYCKANGKYQERKRLGLFLAGNKHSESWLSKSEPIDFHFLATTVHQLLYRLRVKNFETSEAPGEILSFGLRYQANNRELVTFGLLRPEITKFTDIKGPVFYADFDWDYLTKQYNSKILVEEISKYPEVRRDLSLVIDKTVSFKEIKALATTSEKRLLKAVNVFDVYEGENIGSDKKSYSVSFILQDDTQTLTDTVIDRTMQKFIDLFEQELKAVIRK